MNGLDHAILRELRAKMQDAVDEEGLLAASFAVGYEGEIVVAEAYGDATPATPMVIMSPSKTIQDSALWILMSENRLNADDLVSTHVPEFAENGKGEVTVAHLMTHTSGLPMFGLDWPEWSR